ncbi:MAG: type II toxin-antitoxin system RelE/ParE family toxin [Cyanobacteria bacterium J06631_12]
MSQLVWTPAAKADIQKHYDYLYPRNADSADKAVELILAAGKSLARSPKQGRLIDESAGLRKWPVAFGRYGFVIHYALLASEVVILRVYHGRQSRPS